MNKSKCCDEVARIETRNDIGGFKTSVQWICNECGDICETYENDETERGNK